jgi:hypothetical protein
LTAFTGPVNLGSNSLASVRKVNADVIDEMVTFGSMADDAYTSKFASIWVKLKGRILELCLYLIYYVFCHSGSKIR